MKFQKWINKSISIILVEFIQETSNTKAKVFFSPLKQLEHIFNTIY